MPKAPNNTVAQTAIKQCLEAHPAGFRGVNRGSGRGWFSFSHPDECILSKAATTPNQMAAGMIATACSCLYGDRRVDTGPTCADHLQP